MSCQQASRILSTNATSPLAVPEDPYVFTETSNTPPILFNAQKLRNKALSHNQTSFEKIEGGAQISPFNQNTQNYAKNGTKALASLVTPSVTTSVTTSATSSLNKTNKTNLNNVQQSQKEQNENHHQQQHQHQQRSKVEKLEKVYQPKYQLQSSNQQKFKQQTHQTNIQGKQQNHQRIDNNVGDKTYLQQLHRQNDDQTFQRLKNQQIQQQKQLQQQTQQQQKQKQQPQTIQQTPPPLYTHTPSLWQTPLLLDTLPVQMASPPTSPASLPSPPPPPINGCMNPSLSSSQLVSPISAQPLPPSKFHNTTMAQHLQKVECLKKPKRSNNISNNYINSSNNNKSNNNNNKNNNNNINNNNNNSNNNNNNNHNNKNYNNNNNMKNMQKSNMIASLNNPPPLQALQSQQHSENEKNKIPVNVIYRKATSVAPLKPKSTLSTTTSTPTSKLTTSTKFSTKISTPSTKNHFASVNEGKSVIQMISDYNLTNIDDLSTQYNPALPLTPPSPTLLDQVLNPLHCSTTNITNNSLLSPTSTNVISNHLNVAYKSIPVSSVQHKMKESIKKSIPASNVPMTTPKSKVNVSGLVTGSKNSVKRRISPSKNNGSNGPTQKKRRTNLFPISLPLTEKNHQNQIPITAVAVVQHSNSGKFEDSNNLIDPTVLPFCLQAHWLDFSDTKYLLTKSQNREERIANHKSLLRRKALQMLSVRNLQKLPMRLARKRLITVDQLLQKYHDRNIFENQDIKSCIVPDCISPAVIMASHCFKHITNNNTQHIFLPCIAKTEANSQCNAPVFNASDDSPFCEAHIHKREEYKRNLWIEQQKARKVTSISSTSGSHTNIYEPRPQLVQHNYLGFVLNKKVEVNRILSTPPRKRKQNSNVGLNINNNNLIGRPQKRGRKPQIPSNGIIQKSKHSNFTATIQAAASPSSSLSSTTTAITSTPPPLTVVSHQRKSSTTSLESIASNSHSSSSQSMSMSMSHQQQQQQILYQNSALPPPALAPLSNHHSNRKINNMGNSSITASDLNQHDIQNIVSQLTLNTMNNNNLKNLDNINHSSTPTSSSNVSTSSLVTNNSSNSSQTLNQLISNNQKDELQSILNKTNNSMVNSKSNLNGLNSNANISNISLNNNLNNSNSKINSNNLQMNGGNINCSNSNFLYTNNSNSNSSSNFPGQHRYSPLLSTTSSSAEDYLSHGLQDNYHLQNNHLQQQHLQNQQQHIQQYTLQNNPYNKHHDMLSICENSSAYASSEDTGLGGGISEPELMSGTHDVDENPLGDDTRLLEEHDMANVLSTLPEDAFNELFNAVQDDECEQVERALELADKHLKSLQQSIGSESDFLSDFFDVNDDFLNEAANDICNKMEIVSSVMHSPDTSGIDTSLFIDSNGSTPSCIADIRDLVQA